MVRSLLGEAHLGQVAPGLEGGGVGGERGRGGGKVVVVTVVGAVVWREGRVVVVGEMGEEGGEGEGEREGGDG